jgi:GNAT superfamily N-acetyltransferase
MFRFRKLVPSEFDAAARLFVEIYPHRAHEVRFWQQAGSCGWTMRWVAVLDPIPTVVGYAALWNVERRKYRLDVLVDRAWRGRGIGTHLFGIVFQEAKRVGASTVQARAYARCTDAITFLEHRGFVETMRMHGFVLDLSRVDHGALSAWARPITGDDVVIMSVSMSHIDDEQFWRSLCELQAACREGWPDPDPGGPADPLSESELRKMLLPHGDLPLAFFVAGKRDEFVGYSILAGRKQQLDSEAQFVATAVRPEWRNHGIATALRVHCLAVAKAAGYRTVRSASGHPAMLQINTRFGAEESYCEVRLVRRVADAGVRLPPSIKAINGES